MNSLLLKIDPRRKLILRCILTEIITSNKGLNFLDQIYSKYNISTNIQELKLVYQDMLDELPIYSTIEEFKDTLDIIFYDDKDINYETVNHNLGYTIYSKLNNTEYYDKIVGIINFHFTSEDECTVKDLTVYPNFKNRLFPEIDNIYKNLLKKVEKFAKKKGIKYMYINDNVKKISKPLSVKYFYIFLSIITLLKILEYYKYKRLF